MSASTKPTSIYNTGDAIALVSLSLPIFSLLTNKISTAENNPNET